MVSMRLLGAKCHNVKHSLSRDCFSPAASLSDTSKPREMKQQIMFLYLKAEKLHMMTLIPLIGKEEGMQTRLS